MNFREPLHFLKKLLNNLKQAISNAGKQKTPVLIPVRVNKNRKG